MGKWERSCLWDRLETFPTKTPATPPPRDGVAARDHVTSPYGIFALSLPVSLRCFGVASLLSRLKPGFAFPSVTCPDRYQQLPIRSATEAARAQRLLRVGSADADWAGCTVWAQGCGALGQRAGISA